jgi:uncharacterized protein
MNLAEAFGLRPKPYRILTLDGGGVRGIIPVLWLERLEQYIGGPVHTHFDLIAGTSIGAVLGCGFSMGMNAAEARKMWIDGAHIAFAKPAKLSDHARRIANKVGLAAKYDAAGLEALLKSIFKDCRMGDLSRPTLALSYNLRTYQVQVFSSAREEHKKLHVWEVCRASTAAPLFWDAHLMAIDDSGVPHPLADGGMSANNPVVLAISEAVSEANAALKSHPLDSLIVMSCGTGAPPEGQTTAPKTIFANASAILQALMTGATGTDHVTAKTLLPPQNYWRFQVSLPERLGPLDAVENIDQLQSVAMAHLADGADQRLHQLARRLRGLPIEPRFWERPNKETRA